MLAGLSALFVGLAACGDNPSEPGTGVASIAISPGDLSFGALGSTATLTAIPLDTDGNPVDGQPIVWSTTGAGIATVGTSTGVVTAVGNGSTTVRASAGSVLSSVDVTVVQVPVSLALSPGSFSRVGGTIALAPVAADSNGNAIDGAAFSYTSSNPSIVSIEDGVATANWEGAADVTVSGGGIGDVATFDVMLGGPVGGPITGVAVPCSGGASGPFPCSGVDLVSFIPLSALGVVSGEQINDMWGWIDSTTSSEFALVAGTNGVTFVNVTDPLNPRAVGFLPSAAASSSWRDVKVYGNHAYVVADGSPGHGVQIFDLTRLRGVDVFTTFDEDGRYTQVSSVHNIAINEATGFAYALGSTGGGSTCGGGLHMIDLSNPTSPTFAGCFADPTTGNAMTGYTHDVQCILYDGPDTDYSGREICIGANETAISIADVTNKGSPSAVATASYPDARYAHQGWFSEDRHFFFQNDELDELFGVAPSTRMMVWDVVDLDDPILVDEHFGPTGAIDHNMYARGDLLFHSNYHFGLRVLDITNPAAAVEAGYFDTHPADDAIGFNGSWSNYPWFADGIVGVTSSTEGLFLLRMQP